MGSIISSNKDKREYYKQQAASLRKQAADMEKIENHTEADRLRGLAADAEKEAATLDEQISRDEF